jgi:antitoxin ParD1/3/4
MANNAKICQKGVNIMATMNISLPDAMKSWVEQQATSLGRYSNVSDYVRDLIRKEQDHTAKIQSMQQHITDGIESGVGSHTMEELREIARLQAKAPQ